MEWICVPCFGARRRGGPVLGAQQHGRLLPALVAPAGSATTRSAAAETAGPAARRAARRRTARLDARKNLRVLPTEGAERADLDDVCAAAADCGRRVDDL